MVPKTNSSHLPGSLPKKQGSSSKPVSFRCYVDFKGEEFTQMISLKFLQVVCWFTSSLAQVSWGLVIQLISTCRCLTGSMFVFIRRKTPSISSSPWGLQTFHAKQEMHPKLSTKHLGDMKLYDQIETAQLQPRCLVLPSFHMFHRPMLIPWSVNTE